MTHFQKHGAEFGYKNAVEYLKGANRLIQGGDGVETYVRRNGDMPFYREATNEFAVVAKDGKTIRTYVRPEDGYKYFLDQIPRDHR